MVTLESKWFWLFHRDHGQVTFFFCCLAGCNEWRGKAPGVRIIEGRHELRLIPCALTKKHFKWKGICSYITFTEFALYFFIINYVTWQGYSFDFVTGLIAILSVWQLNASAANPFVSSGDLSGCDRGVPLFVMDVFSWWMFYVHLTTRCCQPCSRYLNSWFVPDESATSPIHETF